MLELPASIFLHLFISGIFLLSFIPAVNGIHVFCLQLSVMVFGPVLSVAFFTAIRKFLHKHFMACLPLAGVKSSCEVRSSVCLFVGRSVRWVLEELLKTSDLVC